MNTGSQRLRSFVASLSAAGYGGVIHRGKYAQNPFFLLVTTTALAITASAFESWELSVGAADKIPHQNFKKAWADTGRILGYPKTPAGNKNNGTAINVEWLNPSWLSAEFYSWEELDNKIKLYVSGWAAMQNMQKKSGANATSSENFKSIALGYYQCMNTLSSYQKFLKDRGILVSGSVQDNLVLCSMGRI